MRPIRLALLPLLVATSLAAQTPGRATANGQPLAAVTPRRSAFFDVAAQAIDNRQRFGIESLVFGRFTLGLAASHSRSTQGPTTSPIGVALPRTTTGSTMPCALPGCGPSPGSTYTAWSLDLGVRWYPAAFSISNPERRLMVYLGEFVGFEWRRLSDAFYGPLPMAQSGVCPLALQPGIAQPGGCLVITPPLVTDTHRISGWEPGAELGLRLRPLEPLFIDVGGWFKLVTVDDPTRSVRPGRVDARLVAAIGVGW